VLSIGAEETSKSVEMVSNFADRIQPQCRLFVDGSNDRQIEM
jgi:hypothetical protein